MYFITKKTSDTGNKFKKIYEKSQVAFEAQKQFSEKYGFSSWRSAYWRVFGGISSCVGFEKTPDPKVWGKGAKEGEFYPKKNSKIGKEICKEIKELPTVTIRELNDCVGFDGEPFKTIGYAENNKEYFGFATGDDWEFKAPKDCEEVTYTKYKKLFKVK